MKFHALVIDDDPAILEDVQDRLEGLGHTCDCASCMTKARQHLSGNTYSYVLLDLQIPVRYGRQSRLPNGQNLLREIRAFKPYRHIPIIVMTSHGHDSPDLAVDVFRCDGATDFVKKPFPDSGYTLEKAVRDALDATGRSRPGAMPRLGPITQPPPQPFEYGEMVFFQTHVELCGVKICGDPEESMIRRILDELRQKNLRGRYVCYAGDELAVRIGCDAAEAVSSAVRDFRDSAYDLMLKEANIQIDRLQDIISNDRRRGYCLSEKITVRSSDAPTNDPQNVPENDHLNVLTNDPQNPGANPELNKRQHWIIAQLQTGTRLQKKAVINQFDCSAKTAERDLRDLRHRGRVKFTGPPKTGHWQLSASSDPPRPAPKSAAEPPQPAPARR